MVYACKKKKKKINMNVNLQYLVLYDEGPVVGFYPRNSTLAA